MFWIYQLSFKKVFLSFHLEVTPNTCSQPTCEKKRFTKKASYLSFVLLENKQFKQSFQTWGNLEFWHSTMSTTLASSSTLEPAQGLLVISISIGAFPASQHFNVAVLEHHHPLPAQNRSPEAHFRSGGIFSVKLGVFIVFYFFFELAVNWIKQIVFKKYTLYSNYKQFNNLIAKYIS